MNPVLKQLEDTITQMTASGGAFELEEVQVAGVSYRNYATMPKHLGEYYKIMLAHADRDFAVYQDERYTFAQGYQHGAGIAAALIGSYSVQKGDRVAVLARNSPQWLMAFIGATAAGAVAVPMNSWWTTEELDYGFEDSGAKIVVADRARIKSLLPIVQKHGLQIISTDDCEGLDIPHTPFASLLEQYRGVAMPEVEMAPDDHATIMYTSGSTGHPKGALSSHRGILSALYSWMLSGLSAKVIADSAKDSDAPEYPASAMA